MSCPCRTTPAGFRFPKGCRTGERRSRLKRPRPRWLPGVLVVGESRPRCAYADALAPETGQERTMFRPQYIRTRMRQQPFVPVRFVTSSGATYDVHHPGLVIVGRRDIMIGIPRFEGEEFYDDVARVAILHITAIEDLPKRTKRDGKTK